MKQVFPRVPILVVVLLSAAAVPATAAERATVPDDSSDARLSIPVKAAVRRVAVPALLKELGGQAGVELRTEGPAADLHVTAFAQAPLRDLMRRLALLLHLTWRCSGDPCRPEYTLYASDEDLRAAREALEQ